MKHLQIGINPITWSNDDMPELGGNTPLEVCLTEARAAGYSGIELGNKFPRDPAKLLPILSAHDLVLVSGWYSSNLLQRTADEEIKALQSHLTLLKACRCPVMVFAETTGAVHGERTTPISRRPQLETREWAEFGKRLTAVADYLADQQVPMAYHHHMGTVVETVEDIDRLMEATNPSVGLLFDTGHLTYAGADPLAVLGKHGRRINHVHCKDVRREQLAAARRTDQSFLNSVVDGVFTVPGDGSVAFPPLLRELAGNGYHGWLVVEAEQDPAKAHPLTYARKGFDYLQAEARTAGWLI